MKSIQARLYSYFLGVIGLLVGLSIVMTASYVFIVGQYKEHQQNLFSILGLINSTSNLISEYNAYRNATTPDNRLAYDAAREDMVIRLSKLDESVAGDEARAELVGVENSIRSVIGETDGGVRSLEKGDIADTSTHFTEANRKFFFIEGNVADLIRKQLEYYVSIDGKLQLAVTVMLGSLLVLLAVITLAAIFISRSAARKLSQPLIQLAAVARIVADGKLDATVDPALVAEKDEIGSLSKSFGIMIESLQKSFELLKKSNAETTSAKKELEEKNENLSRLNQLMVGRELRMVELKNKIRELEGKLGVAPQDSALPEKIDRA